MIKDLCRLCGNKDNDMLNIINEFSIEKNIIFKIKSVLHINIKKEDFLPTLVCATCIKYLDSSFDFISCCHRTQIHFKELCKRNVTEVIENESDEGDISQNWIKYINLYDNDLISKEKTCINEIFSVLKNNILIFEKNDACDLNLTNSNNESDVTISNTNIDNVDTNSYRNQSEQNLNAVEQDSVIFRAEHKNSNNIKIKNELKSNNVNNNHKEFQEMVQSSNYLEFVKVVIPKLEIDSPYLTKNKINEKTEIKRKFRMKRKRNTNNLNLEGSEIEKDSYSNNVNITKSKIEDNGELFYESKNIDTDYSDNDFSDDYDNDNDSDYEYCARIKNNKKNVQKQKHQDRSIRIIDNFMPQKKSSSSVRVKSDNSYDNIRKDAKEKKRLFCATCKVSFSQELTYQEHLNVHTGNRPFLCKLCEASFRKRQELNQHLRTIHSEKQFKCSLCDHVAKHKGKLTEHIKSVHEKPFACDICSYRTGEKGKIMQHIANKHTGDLSYVCEICGNGFKTKTSLQTHRQNIHFPEPKVCQVCGTICPSLARYSAHIFRCGKEKKRFPCEKCGKTYVNKEILKDHMNKHLNIKPYKCDVCGKDFFQRNRLDTHKYVHRGAAYHCEVCNQSFNRKDNMKNHMKKHFYKSMRYDDMIVTAV